ncbi:phosphomannomutase [Palleronia rufa]|uniref:phosphomannomutase n=1 Tax=Palleronia rufa TaxID=1530186 RepID=UPI00056C512F|nr:phosphomannomutase [Palleronia rufa]
MTEVPRFGTSGLRGLVSELTDDLVTGHVAAFLSVCETAGTVLVGGDLRPSTPRLMEVVARAIAASGARAVICGAVPTPALALAAAEAGAGAIMVTGSHIPADRNGIKFYGRRGEITKADEAAILSALGRTVPRGGGEIARCNDVADRYHARYVGAFGTALNGLRIGVYTHSAVGRDGLMAILRALGAEVSELGRAPDFVALDTEAVDRATRDRLRTWAAGADLHAIVSTDGDSDRPLLTDARGEVVPGDILGQITARWAGAEVVVTPVSSNSGVDRGPARVIRTRIGSPHVIAGMAAADGRAIGYEANGGVLLGFDANGPAGPLPALPTRDAVLPLLAVLASCAGDVAARVAAEPAVFTAQGRLQEIPRDRMNAVLARLDADPLPLTGEAPVSVDRTDGLRWSLPGDRVIHVRPSGNAPEMRLYVEAADRDATATMLGEGLDRLRNLLEDAGRG